jgi:hypothetical protein
MVKPRGKIRRGNYPQPGLIQALEIDEIKIATWCPDERAEVLPEQVHLILRIKHLEYPFLVRFKSPDTLGFLIEEMIRYRREVWPDAEPLKFEGLLEPLREVHIEDLRKVIWTLRIYDAPYRAVADMLQKAVRLLEREIQDRLGRKS